MDRLEFDITGTSLLEIFNSYKNQKIKLTNMLSDRILCKGLSKDTLRDLETKRDYLCDMQKEFFDELKKVAKRYILR